MEVTARAPGKIILSGEHAVVHGSTAVAASVGLYTFVTVKVSSSQEVHDNLLLLDLKDMGVILSWSIQKIKEKLVDIVVPFSSKPLTCSPEAIKSIGDLVEQKTLPESVLGLQSGISSFIWLYTCILGFRPATVCVNSDLPMGAGLGSSASFCVALSAALLSLSDSVNIETTPHSWFTLKENEMELVNRWAFEGEKIIHGRPSGIDNTVSTFGNVIMFKSGNLTRIQCKLPIRMLITNTKVARNTKQLVAGVTNKANRHQDIIASIFNAVDSISKELSLIIQESSNVLSVSEKEDKLAELLEMNQGLLQCLGVSHDSIESVVQKTLKYKLTSKLTGAGGGGCVLTLLPTCMSTTIIDEVITELESCGFQCLKTAIGGNGVEVCFCIP